MKLSKTKAFYSYRLIDYDYLYLSIVVSRSQKRLIMVNLVIKQHWYKITLLS